MKFFIAFVAFVAVSVATPLKSGTSPISIGAPIISIPEAAVLPAPAVPDVVLPEPGTLPIMPVVLPEPGTLPIMPVVLPTPGVLPILPEPEIILPMPVVQPGPISPISPPSTISPINPIVPPFPIVMPMPVVEPTPVVAPSPVIAAGSSPLVQFIVNVNAAASGAAPTAPAVTPVVAQEPIAPGPVNIVEQADNSVVSPIHVVQPVSPVQVAEPIVPGPVNIVEHPVETPVVIDPVSVGTPILPAPVMTLPEELN